MYVAFHDLNNAECFCDTKEAGQGFAVRVAKSVWGRGPT